MATNFAGNILQAFAKSLRGDGDSYYVHGEKSLGYCSWHSSRPGKEPLVINVEGGGRYCVRLYTKMTNFEVIPYEHLNSQIEEVSCQLAQSETAHMSPIEIKRVDPAVRAEFAPTATFPNESESQR